GTRFFGERVSFKPWPSCRGTHAFMQAAFALKVAHALDPEAIDAITAQGAPLQRMLMEPLAQKRAPETAIDAKFSLPFCIGLALLRERISLDAFSSEALSDARILVLAQRVEFIPRAGAGMRDAASGALSLRMRDGRRLALDVTYALGHPDNPIGTEALT